jgi:hypothetical protein
VEEVAASRGGRWREERRVTAASRERERGGVRVCEGEGGSQCQPEEVGRAR